eukprot:10533166-Alexandrium_andersonii.AAC.1
MPTFRPGRSHGPGRRAAARQGGWGDQRFGFVAWCGPRPAPPCGTELLRGRSSSRRRRHVAVQRHQCHPNHRSSAS